MESSVVWQLLSATGAAGRHTEERWQDAPVGIPTVADRIAQMVVKRHLEPLVEPQFQDTGQFIRPRPSDHAIHGSAIPASDINPADWISQVATRRPFAGSPCAPSSAPWLTDQIADLLRHRQPGIAIVNACGLYGSKSGWRARWPQQRERYGGMIVLTVAEPLAEDEPTAGAGIAGGHILGQHGTKELSDLVDLGRPVAWLACFGGQRRLVSRFSVQPLTWMATGRYARLFRSADTEPFLPFVGNLFGFDSSREFDELSRELRKEPR